MMEKYIIEKWKKQIHFLEKQIYIRFVQLKPSKFSKMDMLK
jgi:hypothetical protein